MAEGEQRKAIKIAIDMLKTGFDITIIAQLTKLSIEQIEALKKKN